MGVDYKAVLEAALGAIRKNVNDKGAYKDMFSAIRYWIGDGDASGRTANKIFREQIVDSMKKCDERIIDFLYDLYKKSLLFDAPCDFDSFLLYVELNRPPEKRFYAPRRHYLRPIVQGYQDLLDGKIKVLTCSLPKRAGKSQLGINFVNMVSGQRPDRSTLMEGTGDDLVKSFYKGCLEYLKEPNDYLYRDVFPEAVVVETNADNKTINLQQASRFPTIMCRSIDARQVGLSEATNVLYMDDCVEGREEAKNRQRLEDKWEIISGDILGRAIEGTPIVFTGTRYSLYDPIGKIQGYAQERGWPWRAIEIPALDPVTDTSNYEYIRDGRRVFTTEYFRDQREL